MMPSQRCPKISHRNTVVRSEILEGWTVALTVGIAEEIRDRWGSRRGQSRQFATWRRQRPVSYGELSRG